MKHHLVAPGTKVDLSTFDPRATPGFAGDKDASVEPLAALQLRIAELQDVLYAQGKHPVLVVLQAMDTGGKDGTVRHVFGRVDPIGVRAVSFKAPSEAELAHDYLWRVHAHVPGNGELVVFNRSHYEDVLVVKVNGWVSDDQIEKRYEHIRAFEQMLVDEGTTIIKCFLHISRDEQRERLQARLDDPTKQWKFSRGDLDVRAQWDEYQTVYGQAITATSTAAAPWHIIPADRKWYRNLAVASLVVDTLEGLSMTYPAPEAGLDGLTVT